jgi:hypothetical protein
MNLDKGNLWTFVSFFTEFSVVLTHPTFLEAAEFPSSDGFPVFCAKPIGNSHTSFPEMCWQCVVQALQILLSIETSTYHRDLIM